MLEVNSNSKAQRLHNLSEVFYISTILWKSTITFGMLGENCKTYTLILSMYSERKKMSS